MAEKQVGFVDHYWTNLGVAGVRLTDGELHVGDRIHIRGYTSDFTQRVESIQIDHHAVEEAKPGDEIGLEVREHAREHDIVFVETED